MANNSLKTSDLPQAGNIAPTDRVLILFNANTANTIPSTRTIQFSSLCANLVIAHSTPANSTANGVAGQITYDNNYIYICIANNTWARSGLSSF